MEYDSKIFLISKPDTIKAKNFRIFFISHLENIVFFQFLRNFKRKFFEIKNYFNSVLNPHTEKFTYEIFGEGDLNDHSHQEIKYKKYQENQFFDLRYRKWPMKQ